MKSIIKKHLRKRLNEIKTYQGHKIPVGEIFLNDNLHAKGYNSQIANIIDVYEDDVSFEDEPILNIPINKIVPTQRFVSRGNLESVKDNLNDGNTGAYLVKFNDLYYVIDGHHRISNRILNGDQSIKAHVYSIN